MKDAHPISSLMDANAKLSMHETFGDADAVLYWQLVGSLIWLLNTRPNLSLAVGILSSFMQSPQKSNWRQAL